MLLALNLWEQHRCGKGRVWEQIFCDLYLVRIDWLGTAVVHAWAEVRVPLGRVPNVPAASRET